MAMQLVKITLKPAAQQSSVNLWSSTQAFKRGPCNDLCYIFYLLFI